MLCNKINKIFILFFLMYVFYLPNGANSYKSDALQAYNFNKTHPRFIEKVIDFYNNKAYPGSEILKYLTHIQWGSNHEDGGEFLIGIPYIGSRYFNHFYDPITGKGFKGTIGGIVFDSHDSITWALSSDLQQGINYDDDYSWPKAIAKAKEGTEDGKAYAYYALGHILHLLHDLTVPAHTRNDMHILDDIYEKWVEDNWNNPEMIDWNTIESTVKKEDIPNLSNLEAYFRRAAAFTNMYFITQGTIDSYDFPDLKKATIREISGPGYTAYYYIGIDENGDEYKIAIQSSISHILESAGSTPPGGPYSRGSLDDECLKGYFKRSAKRAVLYGAGLIKLFYASVAGTDVSGNWKLYSTVSGVEQGPIRSTFTQSGNVITVIYTCDPTQSFLSGNITGTSISLSTADGSISLSGTINGNTMMGIWTDKSGASGTWRAEKTDESCPQYNVPTANISVDGDTSDWAVIEPAITDPAGDADLTNGSDIVRVFIAKDSQNVYARIDLGNGTPHTELYFSISFYPHIGCQEGYRFIFIDIPTSSSVDSRVGDCSYYHDFVAAGEIAVQGSTIEVSVPLQALNPPANSIVRAWNGFCVDCVDLGPSLIDQTEVFIANFGM